MSQPLRPAICPLALQPLPEPGSQILAPSRSHLRPGVAALIDSIWQRAAPDLQDAFHKTPKLRSGGLRASTARKLSMRALELRSHRCRLVYRLRHPLVTLRTLYADEIEILCADSRFRVAKNRCGRMR